MYCCKCNNDLADCTCPDLKERLESLKNCEYLHIGPGYLKRIEKQAENPEKQAENPEKATEE